MRLSFLPAAFFAALLVLAPARGQADQPQAAPTASPDQQQQALPPLLSRLSRHAEQFEEMKRRGSFTLSGKMEELDTSGKVDVTKEMVVRSTATPAERVTEIMKYTEDGADKTAEARQKAQKRRAEKKKSSGVAARDIHLPFRASEQPRYVFSIAERDPNDANRVRVAFKPITPAENAFKGSAWVDEAAGEILTMGFSPSKNPTFVDHVDITMRFDLSTPLGRAPSSINFDARGGFLVVRKHYRGSATITDPKLGF
jgi:hypothetical protein